MNRRKHPRWYATCPHHENGADTKAEIDIVCLHDVRRSFEHDLDFAVSGDSFRWNAPTMGVLDLAMMGILAPVATPVFL